MSLFSRLSDLFSANLSAILDRVENPELMIAHIVREMDEGLAQAKRFGAMAIAAERCLVRELDHHRAQAEYWKNRAKEALAAGREPLARRALVRKKEHDDLVQSLEVQYEAARKTSSQVKASLRALEARLAEARHKQRALVGRHRLAKAQAEVYQALETAFPLVASRQTRFDLLENRLLEVEDELAARVEISQDLASLEAEFSDLGLEQAIDRELEALKLEQGKN